MSPEMDDTASPNGLATFRAMTLKPLLGVMPFDARAKVKSAEMLLARTRASPPAVARARTLALAALRRDPTMAPAWRLLALAASMQGREREAARLFHFAERLSRRDLPTQLWLIEESVSRNDIPGALRHYDIALRTSLASPELLFPVLTRASGDNNVVGPLGTLLASDPPWRETFLWQLVADAPVICSRAEGTVFVVEARGVKARLARLALGRLRQARAQLLGAILTKFEVKRAHFGYGYDYGYGYGNGDTAKA